MTDSIEQIANVHLGRTQDGNVMKRYETPEFVDSTLLVGIPRTLNRENHGICNSDFHGIDVWRGFEISFLTNTGAPIHTTVVISYSSDSPNIIESKSMKLYWNSFNMVKIPGLTERDAFTYVKHLAKRDLEKVVGSSVDVIFRELQSVPHYSSYNIEDFRDLNDFIDPYKEGTHIYKDNPDLLKINISNGMANYKLHYPVRSNCRVTNQPDWGTVFMTLRGNFTLDEVSLRDYIVSLRTSNHFHEEICEIIFSNLKNKIMNITTDFSLSVYCKYTRRGGWDINPYRCSDILMMNSSDLITFDKTLQQ